MKKQKILNYSIHKAIVMQLNMMQYWIKFLNQVYAGQSLECAWFPKIAFVLEVCMCVYVLCVCDVCVCVCVCVCV